MGDDVRDLVLSASEQRTLAAVLDAIIPPSADGKLPGAGELGLATHIGQALRESPEIMPSIVRGLSAVDDLARRRNASAFAALSVADRQEVLRTHATVDEGFLPTLIFYLYTSYYRHPRVVEALGLEARAPHPKGYEMAPQELDPSLLAPVRRRSKLYREC
jgi:hypothetical protein